MAIDPLKIVVDIQNRHELDKLSADAAKAEVEIRKLNAQLQQGHINSGQFAAGVKPFADQIAQTIPRIQELETALAQSGAAGGRGFAQGMLQASYAIDDLQYGLKAVVNNIPQVIYMMGGSAGLAGAIGIVAVAVNVLSNHWEEFASMMSSTAVGETARGILIELDKSLKKNAEGIVENTTRMEYFLNAAYPGLGELYRKWTKVNEAVEAHAKHLKAVEAAQEKVGGVKDKTKEERGKLFGEALRESGGGPKVEMEMADASIKASGAKGATARKAAADYAAELIAKGLAGENVDRSLPPNVRMKLEGLRHALIEKEELKENAGEAQMGMDAIQKRKKEEAEDLKKANEQLKDRRDVEHALNADIMKQRAKEHKAKVEGLQDQQEMLHEQRKAEVERLHEERNSAKTQGAAAYGSTQDYLRSVHEATANMIPKQQLDALKEIDKKLKDVHEAIKNEQRAGRFG